MTTILGLRVTPRSAKPGIGEWRSDPAGRPFLDVRVAAAPVDGAANADVVKIIARALGLARGEVRIVSGETARLKRVAVPLEMDEIRRRLG